MQPAQINDIKNVSNDISMLLRATAKCTDYWSTQAALRDDVTSAHEDLSYLLGELHRAEAKLAPLIGKIEGLVSREDISAYFTSICNECDEQCPTNKGD